MKLLYATSVEYPSTLANREQVLAMAKAFTHELGNSFLLGVATTDKLLPVPHVVMQGSLRSPFLAWRYINLARKKQFTHIFVREEKLLYFLVLYRRLFYRRVKVFYEAHWLQKDYLSLRGVKNSDGIVSITQGLKEDLVKAGIPTEKIIVASDAIDIGMFNNPESKEMARKWLALPQDVKIAGYIGKLDGWKGVETLLKAGEFMPDVLIMLIGGSPEAVAKLSAQYPNAKFLGARPYTELPSNQRAADVLILPNTGKEIISARYTSPLKLFTYMASWVPIVASDLPSLREVIDEHSAFLVEPDNPEALAKGIQDALANKEEATKRALEARRIVESRTWQNRAKAILEFLNSQK